MNVINTTLCANARELSSRLEDALLIARQGKYPIVDRIHELIQNNQELLSNSIRNKDSIFKKLSDVRERLAESQERGKAYKIAEGVFTALKSTVTELPNDQPTRLAEEIRLYKLIDPEGSNKDLLSPVSYVVSFVNSLTRAYTLDGFIQIIKEIPQKNRIKTIVQLDRFLNKYIDTGVVIETTLEYAKQDKSHVLDRVMKLEEVFVDGRKDLDAKCFAPLVQVVESFPENRQDHIVTELCNLRSFINYERLLDVGINLLQIIPEEKLSSVVALAKEQKEIGDLEGFFIVMTSLKPENRADVIQLAGSYIKHTDFVYVYGVIQNSPKNECEGLLPQLLPMLDLVELLRRENVSIKESKEIIEAFLRFPVSEREEVSQLFLNHWPDSIEVLPARWLELVQKIPQAQRKDVLLYQKQVLEGGLPTGENLSIMAKMPDDKRMDILASWVGPMKDTWEKEDKCVYFKLLGELSIIDDTWNPLVAKKLLDTCVWAKSHRRSVLRFLCWFRYVEPSQVAKSIEKWKDWYEGRIFSTSAVVALFPQVKFSEICRRVKEGNQTEVFPLIQNDPEVRNAVHQYLLAQLVKNLSDQAYTRSFCENTISLADKLLIPEDSPLYQKVLEVESVIDLKGKKNPHSMFHDLEENDKAPLLDLKMARYSMGQSEQTYSFSLAKVRDTKTTTTYLAKDIPDEFHPKQLKVLFERLKARLLTLTEDQKQLVIEKLGAEYLKKIESDERGLFNKGFMQEMLVEQRPETKVDPYLYKLSCIIKSMLNESAAVPELQAFSPQELRLLAFAKTLNECDTGQKDGVDLIFKNFDRKDRFLSESHQKKGEISGSVIEDIIREEIQLGMTAALSESAWCSIIGEEDEQQGSHQTEYMSNRVQKQIGLDRALTFDLHTRLVNDRLIEASTQTLAESVFETFPFVPFIAKVKKAINDHMRTIEGNPGEKYRAWKTLIDKVPKFNQCFDVTEDDDDDIGYSIDGINEKGVVEVLKSMGYLVQG